MKIKHTMYSSKTEFDSQYRPFYVYRVKRKVVGVIPAGIDLLYRRTHLHTIDAVQCVHMIYLKEGRLPIMYSQAEWYNERGDFNKALFYKFVRELRSP